MTIYDACLVGYDDYDTETVSSTFTRRARKVYQCEECREHILPGDRYEYHRALWDGIWYTSRTCEVCVLVRSSLYRGSSVIGELWSDVHEAFCGGESCVCP